MNTHPLISVLIPAYNAEKYIAETLRSILYQTYTHFEILIADDGSHDQTKAIIDSFYDARIRTYHNEKNIKKPRTCDKLLVQAKGELITVHDADDSSVPERFEKLVAIFQQNKDIAICGHRLQRMTEKGKRLPLYRNKALTHEEIVAEMKMDNTSGDASMFFKREIIDKIGGLYRAYFSNNMDYDFALRAIEKYKMINIPDALLLYRNTNHSISKKIDEPRKLIMQNMTQFFTKERLERGKDSLMEENWGLIQQKEEEFLSPYLSDQTLYLRETASRHMYYTMNKAAIQYAWQAVHKEPGKMINWRTLQYCLRKSLFGI